MRVLLFLVVCLTLSSCVSDKVNCLAGVVRNGQCGPFKAGAIKFDPTLDAVKPMAPMSYGGYALSEDLLISSFRDRWVGGYSLKAKGFTWWQGFDSPVASPIGVYGSWVVVGLRDGTLVKLESLTGKKVWDVEIGRFTDRDMVLEGKVLILHASNNEVFGIDFQTGEKLWIYEGDAPDPLSLRGAVKPLVFENKVFVGTSKGDIHVLDLRTGVLLRRFALGGSQFRFTDVIGSMVVQSGKLLFSRYDGLVGALEISDGSGRFAWKRELPSIATSTYREGIFYLGGVNGDVIALDALNGERKWRTSSGETIYSISVGEKALYLAGADGQITVLESATGQLQWADNIVGSIHPRPIVFGKFMYFATGLKTLYGYKVR